MAVAVAGVGLVLAVAVVLAVTLGGGGNRKPTASDAAPGSAPPRTVRSAPATPTPTPSPVPNTFSWISLQAGDCFSEPNKTPGITRLSKRDCRQPHDAQVIGLAKLPAGLASDVDIQRKALSLCGPVDGPVDSRQPSGMIKVLNEYSLFPDLASYRSGVRTLTCALDIGDRDSKLTAPLR